MTYFHVIMKTRISKKQLGLTIVELLVALFVGLLLMLAVAKVFEQARLTGRGIQTTQVVQEGARFALDRLAYSIRMSKNAGCTRAHANSIAIKAKSQSPDDVVNLFTAEIGAEAGDTGGVHTTAQGLLKDSAFIKGFQGGANFSLSGSSSLTLANASNLSNGLTIVPDVIRLVGAKAEFSHLKTGMTDPAFGSFDTVNRIPDRGNTNQDLFIISDCDSGEIFYGAAADTNGSTSILYDAVSNTSPALRRAYKAQSAISQLEVKQYFVASSTNAAQFARDGWVLYEQSMQSSTNRYKRMTLNQPILSQITRFNIEYGVNSTNSSPSVVDSYKTADQITDWSLVNMVRITLGVGGGITGTEATASAPYGGRTEQVYSVQAEIRN